MRRSSSAGRLAANAWGQGYATEAALAARDWGLEEIRPRRLISLIHPENARSMRVAKKIGERFQHEVTTHRGIPTQLWALEEVRRRHASSASAAPSSIVAATIPNAAFHAVSYSGFQSFPRSRTGT